MGLSSGLVANKVAFSAAAEAANVITVSLQFSINGSDVDVPQHFFGYLSSDAAGQTPVAATTSLAAGTNGTILVESVSNSVFEAVCEANGDFDLAIGDAGGAATYYLNIICPNGARFVSSAIVFA